LQFHYFDIRIGVHERNSQPPAAILPEIESPPLFPVAVTRSSLLARPKAVRALAL
jgi:hypothetical protein